MAPQPRDHNDCGAEAPWIYCAVTVLLSVLFAPSESVVRLVTVLVCVICVPSGVAEFTLTVR